MILVFKLSHQISSAIALILVLWYTKFSMSSPLMKSLLLNFPINSNRWSVVIIICFYQQTCLLTPFHFSEIIKSMRVHVLFLAQNSTWPLNSTSALCCKYQTNINVYVKSILIFRIHLFVTERVFVLVNFEIDFSSSSDANFSLMYALHPIHVQLSINSTLHVYHVVNWS